MSSVVETIFSRKFSPISFQDAENQSCEKGIMTVSHDSYPVKDFSTFSMLRTLEVNKRKLTVSQLKYSHPSLMFDKYVVPHEVTTVVDVNNLDSMLAWAILTAGGKAEGPHICYNRFNDLQHYEQRKHYVVLGVELVPEHLDKLLFAGCTVYIFSYADGYQYLLDKKYAEYVDNGTLKVIWPFGDVGIEQEITDNSVSKSLALFLPDVLEDNRYSKMIEQVARYTNALPARIFPGQKKSATHQAMMLSLFKRLSIYLKKNPDGSKFVGNKYISLVTNDIEEYMEHYREVRSELQSNVHKEIYGGGYLRLRIATMNTPPDKYHDYLMVQLMTEESFVGYHDTHGWRVWRVYCKNPKYMSVIQKFLKPLHTWMEGSVVCMQTQRPSWDT